MTTVILVVVALVINSVLGFALGVYNCRMWAKTSDNKKDVKNVIIRYIFWPCTTTGFILSEDGVSGMNYYSRDLPMDEELGFDTIKVMSVIGPLPKIAFNAIFIGLTGALLSILFTLSAIITIIGKIGTALVDFFARTFRVELEKSDY